MSILRLTTTLEPKGDQPQAIEMLSRNLRDGVSFQTLLGVTGSGKTFTMASVIANLQQPALVISHNKTLAAQLYQEFREFFPENAVHYFVSYYDYYQPEAYLPHTDTYIEKDAKINELIDRLRHAATQSLLTRGDVIIIASVSCIYGIGEPAEYERASFSVARGQHVTRRDFLRALARLQYARNDLAPLHGTFSVKGEIVEVRAMTGLETLRFEWDRDVIEKISVSDAAFHVLGFTFHDAVRIFPAKHFMTPENKLGVAIENIRTELKERLAELKKQKRPLEAERLAQRTKYDLEMLKETGYCAGIENYSRQIDFRKPGEPPATLVDYFNHAYNFSLSSSGSDSRFLELRKSRVLDRGRDLTRESTIKKLDSRLRGNDIVKDWLLFIDESHMTVPQIRGMYRGDRARKEILIEYGFRLPSALDNRPLTFEEFEKKTPQTVFVSATPGPYELQKSAYKQLSSVNHRSLAKRVDGKPSANNYKLKAAVVEQLIRPTGLLDPIIEVLPIKGQVERLLKEIAACKKRGERALVITLTKRLAEELTDYLKERGIRVQYLHADVKTMARPEILKDLRVGKYDAVVGINLLREGLDLPEVSLVAILDADKEGFLRNETTLIQTIGRAARHINGRVLMFADTITGSMRRAIKETSRRRGIQERYNREHGITPKTIEKAVKEWEFATYKEKIDPLQQFMKELLGREGFKDLPSILKSLEKEMRLAAKELEFERAAAIRDQIATLKKRR